ncbi:hypothetical protein VTH06DRAFT_610 [Thermothelomyces fergusii]
MPSPRCLALEKSKSRHLRTRILRLPPSFPPFRRLEQAFWSSPTLTMSGTKSVNGANGTTGAVKASKANIGVFTNPNHDLWVSEATPTLESVQKGEELKEGQVTVAIRSTGICG